MVADPDIDLHKSVSADSANSCFECCHIFRVPIFICFEFPLILYLSLLSGVALYTYLVHPCTPTLKKCVQICTLFRAKVHTKCVKVYEPPKNTKGCNLLLTGVLQPKCRIMLDYVLIFDCSLRRGYASDWHTVR